MTHVDVNIACVSRMVKIGYGTENATVEGNASCLRRQARVPEDCGNYVTHEARYGRVGGREPSMKSQMLSGTHGDCKRRKLNSTTRPSGQHIAFI